MAGLMDVLGKKPEYDNSSSYQKMMLREISKKLMDMEELNEQNHSSIEELRRLQKSLLAKLETIEMNGALGASRSSGADTVKSDVRILSDQIRNNFRQLSEMMGKDVQDMSAQIQEMEKRLSSLEENMGGFGQQVTDVREGLDALTGSVSEVKETVQASEEKKAEQEPGLESLETLKLSLEDTIHKESIKCFRNVQGALEEQGDGKDQDSKGMRRYLKVIIWFQLITIAIVVLQILGLL